MSDHAGAVIATATLKAFRIATENESKFVIDCSKLRRERSKGREKNQTGKRSLVWSLNSIYVDRRTDATIKSNKRRKKYYQETGIKEHYVVVGGPHEFYLSSVRPAGGTSMEIAKAIFQVIEGTQLHNSLTIIRTDVTAVTTGKNADCIACLKAKLGDFFSG